MSYYLDRGLLVGAAYVLVQELIRPYAMSTIHGDCGGTPCWRACLVTAVQLLYLPLAIVVSLWLRRASLQSWCDECGKRGVGSIEYASFSIFLAFLLVDLYYAWLLPPPPVILRPLMILHHMVCVLGHVYGVKFCPPSSVPCFLCAISALEMGSGASNIFHFCNRQGSSKLIYMLGMTASNAAATTLTWMWNVRASSGGAHVLRRWPPMVVWFVLIYLRQAEVHKFVPLSEVMP